MKTITVLPIVLVVSTLIACAEDPNVVASSTLLKNDVEGARLMYESGEADVNAQYEDRMTVLMHIVAVQNQEFLEESIPMLVDVGADLEIGDKGNRTALHLAAFLGNKKAVELLLHHGADPSAQAGVLLLTPLELARAKGHDEIVALLGQAQEAE